MKNLFIILLLLVSHFNFSQTTSSLAVSESNEYKDEVKAKEILSLQTTSDGITGIVRKSRFSLLFNVFDAELNKTFSHKEKVKTKERFAGELFSQNEIKFFTVYSPKRKERIIYCYIFNLKNKTVTKKVLFEATVETKQPIFSGANKRQTNFAISPNENYFAISTDNIKKNSNSYDIRVFDAHSLNLVYKTAYQEDKEKFYEHNDLIINDEAVVYALGKLFLNGRFQTRNGDANYEFVLNEISQAGTKNVAVEVKDIHIRNLEISVIKDELYLLGFYSEKNSGRVKGGCDFVVDTKNLSISSSKLYELPETVYKDLYGDNKGGKKKDKGKELFYFYIDYILSDDDNTYVLAEKFYITQSYVSNGMNGGSYVTTTHYDDILVLKFNSSGELEWGRSIFKRSTAPSYNAFLKNGDLHVILNSGKNLIEKADGRTKVSKGWFESSSLYDIVFNSLGEISYDKIQDNKGNTEYTPFYGTFEFGKFIMTSKRGGKKNKFMILQ